MAVVAVAVVAVAVVTVAVVVEVVVAVVVVVVVVVVVAVAVVAVAVVVAVVVEVAVVVAAADAGRVILNLLRIVTSGGEGNHENTAFCGEFKKCDLVGAYVLEALSSRLPC